MNTIDGTILLNGTADDSRRAPYFYCAYCGVGVSGTWTYVCPKSPDTYCHEVKFTPWRGR
jgi:hypothetical protein